MAKGRHPARNVQADSRRCVAFGPVAGLGALSGSGPPCPAAAPLAVTGAPLSQRRSEQLAGFAWATPPVLQQPVVVGTGLPLLDELLELEAEAAAAAAAAAVALADGIPDVPPLWDDELDAA